MTLADTWERVKKMPWWWWAIAGVSVVAATGLYVYFARATRDPTDRDDTLSRPSEPWHGTLQ